MCNSSRSPGSLLWLIGAASPHFNNLTPLTFCEQPPRSGWLHRSMGWQENPSPLYPSMQMHLESIGTKGTQIEQAIWKPAESKKAVSASQASKNLYLLSRRLAALLKQPCAPNTQRYIHNYSAGSLTAAVCLYNDHVPTWLYMPERLTLLCRWGCRQRSGGSTGTARSGHSSWRSCHRISQYSLPYKTRTDIHHHCQACCHRHHGHSHNLSSTWSKISNCRKSRIHHNDGIL